MHRKLTFFKTEARGIALKVCLSSVIICTTSKMELEEFGTAFFSLHCSPSPPPSSVRFFFSSLLSSSFFERESRREK